MIILLDTSTPICKFGMYIDGTITWHEWQADRQLANGLLRFITDTLTERGYTLSEATGIAVYKGPGSFTGLRIGLTVMNTLASSLSVPIVGKSDEGWSDRAIKALEEGVNDEVVLPSYGAEAHITKPRK